MWDIWLKCGFICRHLRLWCEAEQQQTCEVTHYIVSTCKPLDVKESKIFCIIFCKINIKYSFSHCENKGPANYHLANRGQIVT